ncbi:hypothetical protein [Geobacter sp. SVR]|uniref:hypothetical protein n=1 Tax=Geobacter sp. SVR TaxID=2495594 RepID=UPI00143EFC16|nr:hypothetical protein [Geobacter sp. SVR]BCS53134.1 hypothetical protein GSVR_14420 [Geobacter sp. SVR]GCF84519.1 hypothetical protein GSbR_11190 [Geobacter sp. SVR]
MNKYLDVIKALKDQNTTVSLYYPGKGFCRGTIEDVRDDFLTAKVDQGNGGNDKLVMHYTQFIMQRD